MAPPLHIQVEEVFMLSLAALLLPVLPVLAQTLVTQPAAETVSAIPSFQAGVGVMWLPSAMVVSGASGEHSASPAATTFGIVPTIDRRISDHLTLGLAVPVLFNVRAAGVTDGGSNEVDVLLRLTGWLPITGDTRLYGFAGAGGYRIFVPQNLRLSPATGDPFGIAAVFGGGAQWAPSKAWFLSGELGLHLGFKLGDADGLGSSYAQATQYLNVSVGAGVPF